VESDGTWVGIKGALKMTNGQFTESTVPLLTWMVVVNAALAT